MESKEKPELKTNMRFESNPEFLQKALEYLAADFLLRYPEIKKAVEKDEKVAT